MRSLAIFSSLRHTLATPGHPRATLLKKLAAGALVIAAGLLGLSGWKENPRVPVFAREVAAGQELAAEDIEWRSLPRGAIPAGVAAETDPAGLAGRVVVAAGSAGEVVTESRLLGEELTHALGESAGQDYHLVPIKLAEPDIAALLAHGDTVSVVSNGGTGDGGELAGPGAAETVVAQEGKIVSTAAAGETAGSQAATILIALPAPAAKKVAAASLSYPLTVVVTGDRAG
ncbi:SAF domain-containing protein [Corynebacterium confusum]|uniref:SAF domain-containing protein n=1 Tax=uncultured Corynebacterium sp. TaxID=159447 RepID=UPI0026010EF2|nr:SAF domain-containing protein [uncultured Corynebacterium sp.]